MLVNVMIDALLQPKSSGTDLAWNFAKGAHDDPTANFNLLRLSLRADTVVYESDHWHGGLGQAMLI